MQSKEDQKKHVPNSFTLLIVGVCCGCLAERTKNTVPPKEL